MKIAINGGVEKDSGYLLFNKNGDINHDPDTYPWPLEDNIVEEVFINMYLHIPKDLEMFLSELYRICKTNTVIRTVNNYYTHIRATDPYANRKISEITMAFYDKNFRELNNLPPLSFNFRVDGMNFIYSEHWQSRSEEQKEFAKIHYWNVIEQFLLQFTVIKE